MSLSQVQGLDRLIRSSTEKERRAAFGQMRGGVRAVEIRKHLTNILAKLFVIIDFGEHVELQLEEAQHDISEVLVEIHRMTRAWEGAEKAEKGLDVVLYGRPNCGKSSILNRLAHDDVAIVSPIAGTTRDSLVMFTYGRIGACQSIGNAASDRVQRAYDDKHTCHIKVINSSARRIGYGIKTTNIKRLGVDPPRGVLDPKEAVSPSSGPTLRMEPPSSSVASGSSETTSIQIGGVKFRLTDTAGIRVHHQNVDEIEAEGMRRARKRLTAADIIIVVVDPATATENFMEILDDVKAAKSPDSTVLLVKNKSDLLLPYPIIPADLATVSTSATSADGIDGLRETLARLADEICPETAYLLDGALLRKCGFELECALAVRDAAIVCRHVEKAVELIGELTQGVVPEQVLDEIFGRFCIGK
uniref:Major sperm protein n=1 Tax=Caenorhabditis japonica TaxID=281687 RepID=A0A8R1HPU6_CAEJA